MNVLVVNQYFPPDTSATAVILADFVKALGEGGLSVRVLCGRPSYAPTQTRARRIVSRETAGRARVERVGSTAFNRGGMAGRATNYLTYVLFAGARALASSRPDVVIVGTDPPLAIFVALVAARGRPVVYSVQDLHPDMALEAGMLRHGLIASLWERAHRWALRRCAAVVCLGESMADRVRAKGVDPARVNVIPNGAPSPAGEADAAVVADLRGDASFVVMHAGNIGGAGAWETLADAAAMLDAGARMVFVGDGARASSLRARGLSVIPFLPAVQLPSVMRAGDLQVVTMRSGMDGLVVPSKLYSILAHGRPVLAVVPAGSEVAWVVRESQCGLVADPSDPDDVLAKIAWARANPGPLAEMGARALEASKRFDHTELIARFVALVHETAARPPALRAMGKSWP